MSTETTEFYDLLSSITAEQVFSFDLAPRENPVTVSCKQLNTSQLRDLIKAAVDSPLTQFTFNSTVTKVFKDSLIEVPTISLNALDRLLFMIETRIQSLSPTKTVEHEGKPLEISFENVKKKLRKQISANTAKFTPSTATEGKITVTFGVGLLAAESQLNEEIYKDVEVSVENIGELRKVIGEAFINEIAKSVQTISVEEKTLDLSTVSFKSRLKAVESLPASLIQNVISYVEAYKKIIDDCLTVNGYSIPVDSTLFSLR
jgi:hypothetical protein